MKKPKKPSKPGPDPVQVFKWASMVAAIAWAILHRLGAEASAIPEFVYVNF